MSLFENILSEMCLLLEDADVNSINDAISNLHPAKIRYNDGENDAKTGERIIYPVAYGISTAGNPVIRAYQPNGDSKRGVPNWKFFKRANITSWDTLDNETFDANDVVGFNPSGDAQIETLYNIAPIGNGKQYTKQPGEPQTAIKPGPITKKDIPGSEEYEKVNNDRYTAQNAVDDILRGVQSKNIDNKAGNNYTDTGDKINAPEETAPIKKSDLKVQDIPIANNGPQNNGNDVPPGNEPIKKSDIEGGNNNPISSTYNDMMKRMDNLRRDNKEEDTEEGI